MKKVEKPPVGLLRFDRTVGEKDRRLRRASGHQPFFDHPFAITDFVTVTVSCSSGGSATMVIPGSKTRAKVIAVHGREPTILPAGLRAQSRRLQGMLSLMELIDLRQKRAGVGHP